MMMNMEGVDISGVTKESLRSFVPIECPRNCLTKDGVLRPWGHDTCFGAKQATALQRLIFQAFWKTVAEFDSEYAKELGHSHYAAKYMVEEFCEKSRIPSFHVEAIRREWMRQRKKFT